MDNTLKTFPATLADALTMLYLQNQDLSETSPERLVQLYFETHDKIERERKALKAAGRERSRIG